VVLSPVATLATVPTSSGGNDVWKSHWISASVIVQGLTADLAGRFSLIHRESTEVATERAQRHQSRLWRDPKPHYSLRCTHPQNLDEHESNAKQDCEKEQQGRLGCTHGPTVPIPTPMTLLAT
jgi:hypothetical protein